MIKIGNNLSEWSAYSCQPKTKGELIEIIRKRISKEGPNCDLNDIDTSLITNMTFLFSGSNFNGDISRWNTSNVKNMMWMFTESHFCKDISNWKINSHCNASWMFNDCPIKNEYKPKPLQS